MSSSGVNLEMYRIPLNEILRVTSNFSSETLIGDGGFGMVHIGELSKDGQLRTIAIKRLNPGGYQGNNEFRNELEMVSSFHHPNIITFIGYCDEANEMIIVYDYAQNGSLDHHFQNPDKRRCITWAQRLKICLGAAKGLKYLHSGLGEHNRVIHRDMKSANILLDENLEAKICDFGLSRFGARNQEDTQLLTKAAGTRYYMDPLYAERSRLRKESDVYSFGVVMFEMSSGTLVYHPKCFGDDDKPQYLIDVVRSCYDDDKKAARPNKLIDPVLRDHIDIKSFHTFNKIAHECINLKLEERPTIVRIIRKIEQAINLQLNHHESPSPSTITTQSLDSFIIPLEELKLATQNFNRGIKIRGYGYCVIYRGQLYGRWQNRTMAVTEFFVESYQSHDKFKKKLRILSGFHHQNISPFIGYYHEGYERYIVNEFPVNGVLAGYLIDPQMLCSLTWAQRLKICVGAARGLQYLHLALGEDNKATRGNIGCENIWLDENMETKISFYGLTKGQKDKDRQKKHISDTYSFGVIMFELLSGRRADELNKYVTSPNDQINLLQEYFHNNELDQFIDHNIRNQIHSHCLKLFKEIAYQCIWRGNQRRIMMDISRNIGAASGSGSGSAARIGIRASLKMDEVVERLEDAADFLIN